MSVTVGFVLWHVWAGMKVHGASDAAMLREAAAVPVLAAPPVPAEAACAMDTVLMVAATANATIANGLLDRPKHFFIAFPPRSAQK